MQKTIKIFSYITIIITIFFYTDTSHSIVKTKNFYKMNLHKALNDQGLSPKDLKDRQFRRQQKQQMKQEMKQEMKQQAKQKQKYAKDRIIVKFKDQGPHALKQRADHILSKKHKFKHAVSSQSDSIDQLN